MTVTDSSTNPAIEPKKGSILYTAYAWTVFVVCLTFAFVAATVLPGLDRRRYWVSFFDRLFFRLAGIRCDVRGLENLPEGHSVVVANHASYLDGPILQAFLPPRFSYVIKSEMQKVPAAGFMLRRIGSRFVERSSASASARDARGLLRAANSGEAMGFFPEGTFRLEPGLGRFRSGAFATAVKSEVPDFAGRDVSRPARPSEDRHPGAGFAGRPGIRPSQVGRGRGPRADAGGARRAGPGGRPLNAATRDHLLKRVGGLAKVRRNLPSNRHTTGMALT